MQYAEAGCLPGLRTCSSCPMVLSGCFRNHARHLKGWRRTRSNNVGIRTRRQSRRSSNGGARCPSTCTSTWSCWNPCTSSRPCSWRCLCWLQQAQSFDAGPCPSPSDACWKTMRDRHSQDRQRTSETMSLQPQGYAQKAFLARLWHYHNVSLYLPGIGRSCSACFQQVCELCAR